MADGEKKQFVWLVTGTSSGFGKHFVTQILARGDKVVATARTLSKIEGIFPKEDNIRLLQLDLDDGFEKLKGVLAEAVSFWGRIDVLVNNAGMGLNGLVEETGSEIYKRQMITNLFGTLDVINATLPHMRERRSGTVVIIGSRSSWRADVPSVGAYAASKSAIRSVGETLSVETAMFGIRTLIVEPAAFVTEGILSQPFIEADIKDYEEFRNKIKHYRSVVAQSWQNDPAKGASAVIDVVRGEGKAAGREWPLYLPLGEESASDIKVKLDKMHGVLEEWHDVITDVKFDKPEKAKEELLWKSA